MRVDSQVGEDTSTGLEEDVFERALDCLTGGEGWMMRVVSLS